VVKVRDTKAAQEAAGVALLRALRGTGALDPADIRCAWVEASGHCLVCVHPAPGERRRRSAAQQSPPPSLPAALSCSRAAPFLNRGLAFQSAAWGALGMRVHTLATVHRQADAHFVGLLHALRQGAHTERQLAELM
jgi:hypothetical protein